MMPAMIWDATHVASFFFAGYGSIVDSNPK
jgi:hypothetical protein